MKNPKLAIAGSVCTLVLSLLSGAPAATTGVTSHTTPVPTFAVSRGQGKNDVSLNVDHAPVNAVLPLLFRRANQSYVLGPHVSGTVTASFNKVPFDVAVSQLLTANSIPLTKTVVNGVYVIRGPQNPPTQHAGRAGRFAGSRTGRTNTP